MSALDTVLSTRSLIALAIQRSQGAAYTDAFDALEKLEHAVKRYEYCVWAAGLQDVVELHSARGMRGVLGPNAELLTYVLAGRTMTTLQGDGHSVTFLSAERKKPSRMGLQSIDGSVNQALALIELAIARFLAGELKMEAAPEAGIV